MLAHESSSSDWASQIVLVKKKDGLLRPCVDYRRLNAVSKVDAYPMPRVDELINNLGKAKYISTLDLSMAGLLASTCRKASPAFSTTFCLYQFKRTPCYIPQNDG